MSLACAQDYDIQSFHGRFDLKKDGTMDVTETIQVRFNIPRRGIFRVIPFRYDTGQGIKRQVKIDNIRVLDDANQGQPIKIEKTGDNLRIRVGQEDVVYPPGTVKTYVFKYSAFGMLNRQSLEGWGKTVEFYWNVTGDQWDVPIQKSSADISYPHFENSPDFGLRVFAGPYGSREFTETRKLGASQVSADQAVSLRMDSAQAQVSCEKSLAPGSGLTVVLALPATTISEPTTMQWLEMWVFPNLAFGMPIVVLPFMYFVWRRHGRDPDGGPMVVQYDPPDDITGPEAGTFLDERVDQRDVASGIISLAVKGYLRIIPTESGMVFKKKSANLELTGKPEDAQLTRFESKLLNLLQLCDNPIDSNELRSTVAPNLSDLQNSLYESLVARNFYPHNPNNVRLGWMIGGVITLGLACFLFAFLTPYKEPLPLIAGGGVSAIIILLFGYQMPRRTAYGAKQLAKIKGFEEFMKRAKSQELDWLSARHPDQALFEKYLPHAVAFGLTTQWAQRFQDIVREMPDWYVVPRGTPFHYGYFGNDFTSMTNDIGSSVSTPPRSSGASGGSSGFGGGGFSGGGFGGGGGGSW